MFGCSRMHPVATPTGSAVGVAFSWGPPKEESEGANGCQPPWAVG